MAVASGYIIVIITVLYNTVLRVQVPVGAFPTSSVFICIVLCMYLC
jgi:hypothetical protein